MSDVLFKLIYLLIPVLGVIITGFIIPYIQTKISVTQMSQIIEMITKAVNAAEVLFKEPSSGTEKREYVIDFIDRTFNSKREIITKEQIRVLLEAAWREMKKNNEE